jgi:hypothetical protein
MPKTTFTSTCELCSAKFEGEDAETLALGCEKSHHKAVEIIEQKYNSMSKEPLLPSEITVKIDSGASAKYYLSGR